MAHMHARVWPISAGPLRRVYFTTLGTFGAYVDQQPAVWNVTATGVHQLERAVAFLIARRDQFVRKEMLIDVAGGRSPGGARHVISSVQRLLRSWGMGLALTVQNAAISLRKHEVWGTDTDALELLLANAETLHQAGHDEQAISVLQDAAPLCGGDYLSILDTSPAYMPYGESAYWKTFQKNLHSRLAQLCLDMPNASYYPQALRAAGRAIEMDRFDPETCLLAARAARACGNEEAARRFEIRAGRLRSASGEP